ncbi:HPr family phosphocarrier protein [Luteococcus peritonei]|uniref:Phosphocarrier protein HPr n=1 Tax=Luteococcus peritonei TaxID=88874 RepID=A0ABW4RXM9_9ACTN
MRLRLGNPHGLHARPAAALVGAIAGLDAQVVAARGDGPTVDARSMTALGGLGVRGGDELRLVAHGPEALLAVQRLLELATDDFGEDLTAAEMDDELDEAQAVAGLVHHLDLQVDTSGYAALAEPEAERARLLAATDAVDALLLELDGPGVQGQVMHALRGLLHDPGLVGALRTAVLGGASSARAVAEVYDRQVDVFASMDNPYLRERATDLRLLRRLLLAGLLGRELTLPELAPDSLLVVDELDAVTAAQLDPETCGGVVVLRAGRAGHGVEVATARGIAVVDGHREAAGWPEGGHAHLSLEV